MTIKLSLPSKKNESVALHLPGMDVARRVFFRFRKRIKVPDGVTIRGDFRNRSLIQETLRRSSIGYVINHEST